MERTNFLLNHLVAEAIHAQPMRPFIPVLGDNLQLSGMGTTLVGLVVDGSRVLALQRRRQPLLPDAQT